MGGGLIQLVAVGVQDLYLTSDPQITFYKLLYRRHTNFSIESIVQNFSTKPNFGEISTCTLSASGDLIGQTFLYVEIPAIPKFIDPITGLEDPIKKFAWVRSLGSALIKEITLEIGGKLIDRQYGEFMYLWAQVANRQDEGLAKMIGNIPKLYEFSNGKKSYGLYIPLTFYFCKESGLAIPLIALASSEVKITVTFRRLEECYRIGPTHSMTILEDIVPLKAGDYIEQTINNQKIYGYVIDYDYLTKKLYYIKIQSPSATLKSFESLTDMTIVNCVPVPTPLIDDPFNSKNIPYRIYNSLTLEYCTPKPNTKEEIETTILPYKPKIINSFFYVNYTYLDTEERLRFARNTHEYLIIQVQFNQELGVKSPNVKQELALNHPCKSHYWVAQLDSLVGLGTINDLFNYTTSHIRYPDGRLYGENLVESAVLLLNGNERFGMRPSDNFNLTEPYSHHYRGPTKGINVYSFSLNPEDHQPSAACNMTKIDSIEMLMKLNKTVNPQNQCKIRAYTLNYNILRVAFNLGGIAFI